MIPPRIHQLLAHPLDGSAIERESLRRIDAEAPSHALRWPEWQVARRIVHATADFALLEALRFSADALPSACAALRRGAPIYVDSNMIAAGLSRGQLARACPHYAEAPPHVYVADEDVRREALASGLPRALFAVRKARPLLDGAIACFGNSPVGLLELNRIVLEEGIRPAVVIAMPVGFVHVVESKQESMTTGVPYVVVTGRRGGSPLVVATLHATAHLAKDGDEPVPGEEAEGPSSTLETSPTSCLSAVAIVLLGHGSREPGASTAMERVAAELSARLGGKEIRVAHMELGSPGLGDVVGDLIRRGTNRIIILPYFLHCGRHLRADVPAQLELLRKLHPGAEVVLGDHLGFDPQIVSVLERRLAQALQRFRS